MWIQLSPYHEGCPFRPRGQAPAASSTNTGFKGPTATTHYKDLVRRDRTLFRPVGILVWTSGHCITPKYKDLGNLSSRNNVELDEAAYNTT